MRASISCVPVKYVIVTGGVLSGLGKGITTSSIGKLLKSRGIKLTAVKIDPYVNIDAGTMNPFEHGEVFVLDDGGEVDQDLGNYERFLDIPMGRENNITTGKAYKAVIDRERRGDYLGKTVQIIPHVTTEIKEHVQRVAKKADADVCLVEVGGTVGDIESAPFLEALRQLHLEEGHKNVVFVHTTLVPVMGAVGEQKTKPTQHSVMEMRRVGVHPDMLVCRSETRLDQKTREKLALFCDVEKEAVISAPDARTIYEVPLILEEQGVADWIIKRLDLTPEAREMTLWKKFVDVVVAPRNHITIGVVGKYTDLADAYLSIQEAFVHSGAAQDTKVLAKWIDAEDVLRAHDPADVLGSLDGILVPGGFGPRGSEGKMKAIQYAREAGVPFLGICLGFQLATVEYARNVIGLTGANSTELDPKTPHPVIDLLPGHTADEAKGATMRLGASEVRLAQGTKGWGLYKQDVIFERHRHRWEVNPGYISKLEDGGLRYVGRDPSGDLMEVLELPDHPFFLATQYHPEFKSRPERPAPTFMGLVGAAIRRSAARKPSK